MNLFPVIPTPTQVHLTQSPHHSAKNPKSQGKKSDGSSLAQVFFPVYWISSQRKAITVSKEMTQVKRESSN